MKERAERLKVIKAIIKENRVDSQEKLLQILEDHGYSVTQATLSRDLKYLKVGKLSDGHSGYYYSIPSEEERREYIKNTFRCIADCDMCGLCTVFRGKDPEVAYADYINGKRVYLDVSKDYR